MSFANFVFNSNSSSIEILGSCFNIKSLEKLLHILSEINNNKEIKEVNILGNFNTTFFLNDINTNEKKNHLDEILILFQSITKNIEESNVTFISNLNNLVQGPGMEIALSCNFIKAEKNTLFQFNEVNNGLMPFCGSIQRLSRIIGYKNTLETLLIKKYLSYDNAFKLNLVNQTNDNSKDIRRVKSLWDQSFTNTFIFYNSKIHSITKNKLPAYNAILSSIFEGFICGYEASLSLEKRWLKWLLNHKYTIENILK